MVSMIFTNGFLQMDRALGNMFWMSIDRKVIDGWLVNGAAAIVDRSSSLFRRLQSGFVYHYAFAMIIGLVGLTSWLFFA